MGTRRDHRQPELFRDALVDQQARVAGDVIEIAAHTWAVHGIIPVDGDVILAEFDSAEAARAAVDRLGP